MSDLEKEYKSRFQDHQTTEGVDSDSLWASIEADLSGSAGGGKKGLWLTIGGIVLMLTGIGVYMSDFSSTELSHQDTATVVDERTDSQVNTQPNTTDNHTLHSSKNDNKVDAQLGSDGAIVDQHSGQTEFSKKHTNTQAIQEVSNRDDASSSAATFQGAEPQLPARTGGAKQLSPENTSVAASNSEKQNIEFRSTNQAKSVTSANPKFGESQSTYEQSLTGDSESNSNGSKVSQKNDEVASGAGQIIEARTDMSGGLLSEKEISSAKDDVKGAPVTGINLEDSRTQEFISLMPLLSMQTGADATVSDKKKVPEYARKKGFRPSEISLSVGVNHLDRKFETSIADVLIGYRKELNSSSITDVGYTSNARGTWMIKNSTFRLSTGLGIDQFRTRLDFSNSRQVSTVIDGQIVAVEIDSTGAQTPVYGSSDVNAVETRIVLHHNDFLMLNIPIEVGVQTQLKRWTFGVDAGASYHLVLSQKGRGIDAEGAITDFDSSGSGSLPLAKSFVSIQARPFISWTATDKLGLRLTPSFKTIPTSDSDFHGVKSSATAFGLSAGLVFILD